MGTQLQLHNLLTTLLGPEEPTHAYFQPPESFAMKYPCIVYSRDDVDVKRAANSVYGYNWRYELIVIDEDPESELLKQVLLLPMCSFERHYEADQLNHDVFNLYF